jgi:hypothetical protein
VPAFPSAGDDAEGIPHGIFDVRPPVERAGQMRALAQQYSKAVGRMNLAGEKFTSAELNAIGGAFADLADMALELTEAMFHSVFEPSARPPKHWYVSTACIHEKHADCRRWCKYNTEAEPCICACPCHMGPAMRQIYAPGIDADRAERGLPARYPEPEPPKRYEAQDMRRATGSPGRHNPAGETNAAAVPRFAPPELCGLVSPRILPSNYPIDRCVLPKGHNGCHCADDAWQWFDRPAAETFPSEAPPAAGSEIAKLLHRVTTITTEAPQTEDVPALERSKVLALIHIAQQLETLTKRAEGIEYELSHATMRYTQFHETAKE